MLALSIWMLRIRLKLMRMNGELFLIGLFVIQTPVYAQFTNNYWVWGDSATIDWTNPGTPLVLKSAIVARGCTGSFKDTTNRTVFSCDLGSTFPRNNIVMNKYNLTFINGDSMRGTPVYHDKMILPDPGNDSLIYIINAGVTQSIPMVCIIQKPITRLTMIRELSYRKISS